MEKSGLRLMLQIVLQGDRVQNQASVVVCLSRLSFR
jgi:hypothetical protein